MFFYQSPEVMFLFEDWHITDNGPYIASIIATIFIGVLMELVTFAVSHLKSKVKLNHLCQCCVEGPKDKQEKPEPESQKSQEESNQPQEEVVKEQEESEEKEGGEKDQDVANDEEKGKHVCKCALEKVGIQWILRLVIAATTLAQMFLAYLIMMIAMTYNVILFLAPVLGMILGYIGILFIQPRLVKQE